MWDYLLFQSRLAKHVAAQPNVQFSLMPQLLRRAAVNPPSAPWADLTRNQHPQASGAANGKSIPEIYHIPIVDAAQRGNGRFG
ncbi:hypothetical protein Q0601_15780 [Paracoccus onubensis]|uniref:hypothetical protein n=1 Tax=Paracoccus onubensis TaxID=1675788 RepID=UPI00272F3D5E|nr:hypothetical protein [Paracoccus onubensis]MDP0928644.1 hypothetical protein [Paracoccus onubensis]